MAPDDPVDPLSSDAQGITVLRRPEVEAVDVDWIPRFVCKVMELAGAPVRDVTVVLAGDDEVHDLNRRFRSKDSATDILSFPADESAEPGALGEVIIAFGKAGRQAAQRHHSLEVEIRYLLVHGILHLLGFDHETDSGEMNQEEGRIRARLGNDLEPAGKRAGGVDS